MSNKRKASLGSSFESWLEEEGIFEEVTAAAIKGVIAEQLAAEMKRLGLTKTSMAERLQTSRAQLDRLLDPDHAGVSLDTLQRAAKAVGRRLRVELV
jgi:hypothetical protein